MTKKYTLTIKCVPNIHSADGMNLFKAGVWQRRENRASEVVICCIVVKRRDIL
jgi:hypothetical protein